MNNIFDRVTDIERAVIALITDIEVDMEYCENNKEEICNNLIDASWKIGEIYNLNKANFNEETS
jgi:hypothetical protein